jgi:hypothetical protein
MFAKQPSRRLHNLLMILRGLLSADPHRTLLLSRIFRHAFFGLHFPARTLQLDTFDDVYHVSANMTTVI